MLLKQLKPYIQLMRFDKPIGIYLLLWPTVWSLWIAAKGIPSIKNLVIFILGVIVMRAAGCVINDYADRHVDGKVARTNQRPLATKRISSKSALLLFFSLCFIAFILVCFTNRLTIAIAFFALLFAAIYPFMKRFTHWPQLILGIAFSFSSPMAFAAESGTIPSVGWILMLTTVLWTIAYDTQYAMVDYQDDLKIGIKSTAILFGKRVKSIICALQISVLSLLTYIGYTQHLTWIYFLFLCLGSLLFLHQKRLLNTQQRQQYFQAFLSNHWFGCLVFIGILLSFLM